MAGGGVGEAMLIGAAVGAGTGGIMSAAQDKDVGQGMLLGALGGAATGGIGSGIGGAAGSAIEGAAANTATDVAASTATDALANTAANTAAENTVNTLAQQGSNQAANSIATMPNLSSTASNLNTTAAANAATAGSSQPAAGMGQGIFPGMSNANVAGAATTGGISGLMAANGQPAPYEAPGTETYNGPLSKFKMAGPQLNQYSYDPNTFRPSVAPGYADGGIATLQTGMFPQSQMDRTQFATPSQMPISREIIGSDYDATISPYTGDLPRFSDGGGIDFIRNLQPGGAFGDATSELYGAVDEALPFLKDITPGGFVGALQPGRKDWEDKQRKKKEEEAVKDQAAKEARAAAMYNQMAGGAPSSGGAALMGSSMARGGIADLGSYSDGGRLLKGPGDGMSDNIPASIAGKQPARLADGEFVVPADVVSGLGNGSTDAGAKTLYSMMNKVRKARTGTTRQGKEIHADKYMPKMAQGGIASFAEGGLFTQDESGNYVPYTASASAAATPAASYNPSIYNPYVSNPNYVAPVQGGQFDAKKYLEMNPDVAKAGVDPLQHYQMFGKNEGRQMPTTVGSEAIGTPTIADPKYSAYTIANRPSSTENQFYGNIYRGDSPDFSTPGYTLTGGNLGRWNNVAGEQQRAAQPASMNQQVTQAYLQELGRAPDTQGLSYWMGSGLTGQEIRNRIAGSDESLRILPGDPKKSGDFIGNLYQQYLNRTPEEQGLSYWQNALKSGNASVDQVRQSIINSPEAQNYERDFITNAYQQYLGRAPEAHGLSDWQKAMQGTTNQQDILNRIMGSDEAKAYAAAHTQPAQSTEAPKEEKKRRGGIAALRRA